jgi:hypothetical protein
VAGLSFFGLGREAYALRAVWKHDGRVSERARERSAWRPSTDGAFMVAVVVYGCDVVMIHLFHSLAQGISS